LLNQGLVVKSISGFYTVKTAVGQETVCRLPGKLKREKQSTDIVAVGDYVTFTIHDEAEGEGLVQSVQERKNALSRVRPSAHNRQWQTDKEQVLVANVDQVVFVFSLRKPKTHLRKLDRLLAVAEQQHVPAVICVNKIDLAKAGTAEKEFQIYEQIGYPVMYVSATEQIGIDTLQAQLKDRVSVFAGSSGVGKSSLLNAVQPGLALKTGAVSQATTKGMHTTRYAELFELEQGGYVADTPGIRGWALYDVEPDEIDGYFREIAPLVSQCQFSDCTHIHEPGCAVRTAVAQGNVSAERYDSYLRLREEHEALINKSY